jgi:beta-mannosidase
VPRFCSEFGQQGPSNIDTLKRAELLNAAEGPMPRLLAARQRGPGGNRRWYDDPAVAWFQPPCDFGGWHYMAQLLQARSLAIGIEWQRSNMPHCMGSLIWQLNDAWPGLSWSLIDSDGKPKLAYFTAQRAFQDRLLTIQPFDGKLWLVAVNDSGAEWNAELRLRRLGLDGASLAESNLSLHVESRCASRLVALDRELGGPAKPARELIVADADQSRASWFYVPDREIEYPWPEYDVNIDAERFRLTARALIRDAQVTVFDDDDAPCCVLVAPQSLLLPGESCDLRAHTGQIPPEQTVLPFQLRCANHFGKPIA